MSNNYDTLIGQRIRTARKNKKMSMKELGARVGMSEGNISRYEKGFLSLDISQAKEFAKVLDVSASYLCGWDNNASVEKDIKKWFNKVGELNFSDEEFEELTNYAKYIVSKRK